MQQKLIFFTILIIHYSLIISHCNAQWSTDPTQNLPIYYGAIGVEICTDGTGGAFVGITTASYVGKIQRLNRFGVEQFNPPIVISQNPDGTIIEDVKYAGNGESYILYFERTFIPPFDFLTDLYVNKVDSSGVLLWGNGVKVTLNNNWKYSDAYIEYDYLSGGCYVVYSQSQSSTELTDTDSYIQHFDSLGNRLFTDFGLKLNISTSKSEAWQLDINLKGDVYVNSNGRVMRVDSTGLKWSQEYWMNPSLSALTISSTKDGFFELTEEIIGSQKLLKVKKVNEDQSIGWNGLETIVDTVFITSPIGGANSFSAPSKSYNEGLFFIYGKSHPDSVIKRTSQVISVNGNLQFPQGGISMLPSTFIPTPGVPFPALANLKLFLFGNELDPTNTGFEIYCQRIDKNGNKLLNPFGKIITNRELNGSSVTNDLSGGGIIAWLESPAIGGALRIQQVSRNGNLAEVLPLTGDLNNDSKIDSTDSQMILDFITGKIQLNQNQLESADTDGDTKITVNDASNIRRLESGEIHILPVYFYNSN